MFKFKLSRPGAKTPTVAHDGDLGFDIYAAEEIALVPGVVTRVMTGLHIELTDEDGSPMGALVKDRSSMSGKGITTSGGVIDAGYRGEIVVHLTMHGVPTAYHIYKGDKIAQLVPVKPQTKMQLQYVTDFEETSRFEKGFGSSGSTHVEEEVLPDGQTVSDLLTSGRTGPIE